MAKKKKSRIRPLAICVFRQDDLIFVSKDYDSVKDEVFYRPLGGKIEFGEYASDTVKRELMEEIKHEITEVQFIGTLESIFTHEGQSGHEIALVFQGRFVDETLYDETIVVRGEDDGDVLFDAVWRSLDFFRAGNAPLYPDGMLELLENITTKKSN